MKNSTDSNYINNLNIPLMKTFSQFLNEGLSRNTSSVTGCDAIKKNV
jgi:hypothetical protein